MKITPALQLLMKATANASARRIFNLNLPLHLNPWGPGAGFKKKPTPKLKTASSQ